MYCHFRTSRSLLKVITCEVGLLLVAGLLWSTNARAENQANWVPRGKRVERLVNDANKHKLAQITPAALQALQKAYPGIAGLTVNRVRVVDYESPQFAAWAGETGRNEQIAGFACTPHRGGPHPHFVAYYRGWPFVASFDAIMHGMGKYQDGTETRAEGIDVRHGTDRLESQRVFCLFAAPSQHVAAQADLAMKEKERCKSQGPNCAIYASGQLRDLFLRGQGDPNNPAPNGIAPGGYPVQAVSNMMSVEPDLIVHAVPHATFVRWQREGRLDGAGRPTDTYRLNLYE